MTVSSTIDKKIYTAIGGTDYSFPYYFIEETDLTVYREDADGDTTTLTLTADYTVVGEGLQAGGTVTTVAAYTDGKVIVERDVPNTQGLDATDGDGFKADVYEMALDRLTMMVQQHTRQLEQTLRLEDGTSFTGSWTISNLVPGYVFAVASDGSVETISVPSAIQDTIQLSLAPADASWAEGKMWWDTTSMTLNVGLAGGVTMQVGQEMPLWVKNGSGVTVDDGKMVYVSGSTGANLIVGLADASDLAKCSQVGMITTPGGIANNAFGFVTRFGAVRDVDTSAFSEADIIYLSATTPGEVAAAPPGTPHYTVAVGLVISDHATQGVFGIDPKMPHAADVALSLNSDLVGPTQKAVKTYVDKNDRPALDSISGLSLASNTINSVTAVEGACYDSGRVVSIYSQFDRRKNIDAEWEAGSDVGGFPSAGVSGLTLSNGTSYHFFVIAKADGNTDAGFDSNLDASVLLNADNAGGDGFTLYRRLGSIYYVDGTTKIKDFTQLGNDFIFSEPIQDASGASSTGSRGLHAITTPLGIKVKAHLNVFVRGDGTVRYVIFTDPDTPDVAPSATVFDIRASGDTSGISQTTRIEVITDTSSQVGERGTSASSYDINTRGWTDERVL